MAISDIDPRYAELIEVVAGMHEGVRDPLGRPRYEHFERVAQLLLDRDPNASKDEIEAALLHDVITHPTGGLAMLETLSVSPETTEILKKIVPPPNAKYYTDIENFTADDNRAYLEYVYGLVASGHREAIAVKLADIEDTVSYLRAIGSETTLKQLARQYEPSRKILQTAIVATPTTVDRTFAQTDPSRPT
jgi:(p)ppGpp synthase/HD superfamily hydrolase